MFGVLHGYAPIIQIITSLGFSNIFLEKRMVLSVAIIVNGGGVKLMEFSLC